MYQQLTLVSVTTEQQLPSRSPAEERVDAPQVWAARNRAAVTLLVQSACACVFLSPGKATTSGVTGPRSRYIAAEEVCRAAPLRTRGGSGGVCSVVSPALGAGALVHFD